ncbi:MAG: phosphopantetheine-binding protein [Ruminococcus sp.]
MTRQEILENLKEILMDADERGSELVDKVSEQSRLTEDLGLSSVNMLYMIIATEEVFDIRFDDVGVNEFQTVGDVIDYIEGKLA